MKSAIGIGDASEYDTNLNTDWKLARKHGCEFGIVRASSTGAWVNGRPSLTQDKEFLPNGDHMAAAGVKRMSYAWFDPRVKLVPALDQAKFYLNVLAKGGGPGELGPMIDIEDAPAAGIYNFVGVGQHIKIWLDVVEKELRVRPRIYTNASYTWNYLFNSSVKEDWLNDYGLVIANWGVTAPNVPQPWASTAWDVCQYRADAPGKYYGFFNKAGLAYSAPNICLAVWNGPLP
jgi:hypothetical protein